MQRQPNDHVNNLDPVHPQLQPIAAVLKALRARLFVYNTFPLNPFPEDIEEIAAAQKLMVFADILHAALADYSRAFRRRVERDCAQYARQR